jgi:hypothetical protein
MQGSGFGSTFGRIRNERLKLDKFWKQDMVVNPARVSQRLGLYKRKGFWMLREDIFEMVIRYNLFPIIPLN